MSCRVIGRRAESAFLAWLLDTLAARGVRRLRATYAATAKNALVRDFWTAHGFSAAAPGAFTLSLDGDGAPRCRRRRSRFVPRPTEGALDRFEQLRDIMALTFDVAPDTITTETTRESCAKWDSLAHLNLMLALEDGFSVTLTGRRDGRADLGGGDSDPLAAVGAGPGPPLVGDQRVASDHERGKARPCRWMYPKTCTMTTSSTAWSPPSIRTFWPSRSPARAC